MRTEFLCISVLRVASAPRVKLASCKSALNPAEVYSTDRSKAAVPVLVLLFVALWFILRGDLFYILHCVILFLCFSFLLALRLPRLVKKELTLMLFVHVFDLLVLVLLFLALWFILRGDLLYVFPCVILFLCFSVLLVLRLPRLGKRELILVLFVRLFGLCLFRFVGFLFLLGSGKGCGLWLWQSLDFSLTFFSALVWFCLFALPLGDWDGLRFVIVALPGLFSTCF